MNDLPTFGAPLRAAAFEPERLFPIAPKPQPQRRRVKLRDTLRAFQQDRRLRALDRREAQVGAAGRIHMRWEADADGPHGERVAIYAHYSSTGRISVDQGKLYVLKM